MSDETKIQPTESECSFTDQLKCPYCGYEDRDSWDYHADDGEVDCGNCESEYSYTRNVEVTYTSTKMCTCGHAFGYHEYPNKTCHHKEIDHEHYKKTKEIKDIKCTCKEFKSVA